MTSLQPTTVSSHAFDVSEDNWLGKSCGIQLITEMHTDQYLAMCDGVFKTYKKTLAVKKHLKNFQSTAINQADKVGSSVLSHFYAMASEFAYTRFINEKNNQTYKRMSVNDAFFFVDIGKKSLLVGFEKAFKSAPLFGKSKSNRFCHKKDADIKSVYEFLSTPQTLIILTAKEAEQLLSDCEAAAKKSDLTVEEYDFASHYVNKELLRASIMLGKGSKINPFDYTINSGSVVSKDGKKTIKLSSNSLDYILVELIENNTVVAHIDDCCAYVDQHLIGQSVIKNIYGRTSEIGDAVFTLLTC